MFENDENFIYNKELEEIEPNIINPAPEDDDDDIDIVLNPNEIPIVDQDALGNLEAADVPEQEGISKNTVALGYESALKIDGDPPLLNGVPITEVPLSSFQDKPWRMPGADITEYFNYGFGEDTWTQYCQKQQRMKAERNCLITSAPSMNGLGRTDDFMPSSLASAEPNLPMRPGNSRGDSMLSPTRNDNHDPLLRDPSVDSFANGSRAVNEGYNVSKPNWQINQGDLPPGMRIRESGLDNSSHRQPQLKNISSQGLYKQNSSHGNSSNLPFQQNQFRQGNLSRGGSNAQMSNSNQNSNQQNINQPFSNRNHNQSSINNQNSYNGNFNSEDQNGPNRSSGLPNERFNNSSQNSSNSKNQGNNSNSQSRGGRNRGQSNQNYSGQKQGNTHSDAFQGIGSRRRQEMSRERSHKPSDSHDPSRNDYSANDSASKRKNNSSSNLPPTDNMKSHHESSGRRRDDSTPRRK